MQLRFIAGNYRAGIIAAADRTRRVLAYELLLPNGAVRNLIP